MAEMPPTTSPPLRAAIFSIELTSSAMDPAISTRVTALTLPVKALSESVRPLRISSKTPAPFLSFSPPLPKMPSTASLILSKAPPIFCAARNIPPPARPAKISPPEMLSVIHVRTSLMTFLTRSNAPPRTSPIIEAIDLTADPIEEIPPVKELKRPRTPLMAVPTPLAAPSKMPNCLIDSSSPTSQSPNPAAISSRLSSKPPMLSDPNAVAMASPTALTACTPISKTEKTPSATRPILFSVDSEGIRRSVNEVNASVMSISC